MNSLAFLVQLASVILKQYVETHWCAQSEKFRLPETTERVSFCDSSSIDIASLAF